jgi:acyl-[acyl-carrier-protein]-phospholipid O-acyltransferase/long-chain-fatty-acid--[acyl-carrier-protein] ligase
MSTLSLFTSRRFGAMFVTMALGAFNDNFYKNALIIIVTYTLAKQMQVDAATLLSAASAAFILPFFLFSGISGELADRVPKYKLVRILKLTELGLIVLAAGALYHQHAWSLMVILFLIGVQAAVFGPIKYSILPELLKKEELLQGNAIIEAGTFISILLGTIVGGLLILQPSGPIVVGVSLIVASLIGVWAAYRVPVTTVANPSLKLNYNIFSSTWKMVRHAFENPGLIFPILGISWFWAIGATYLTQLPVFTKEIIGADEKVVTLFNGVFTIGIALGSFFCPMAVRWMGRHAKHLPTIALFGVFAFGLDVCFIGHHAPTPTPNELVGLLDYLTASEHHLRLAIDLFLLAFCGGVFIVPLYTQLQTASDESERARTIASNNVMNAFFIATSSLLAAIMFGYGFTVLQVLFVFALLNVPVIGVLAYWAKRKRVVG